MQLRRDQAIDEAEERFVGRMPKSRISSLDLSGNLMLSDRGLAGFLGSLLLHAPGHPHAETLALLDLSKVQVGPDDSVKTLADPGIAAAPSLIAALGWQHPTECALEGGARRALTAR